MNQGRFEKPRKRVKKKKPVILLVSIVAVVAVLVGSTLAFLSEATDPVTNTFTPSSVTTDVVEDTTSTPGTKKNVQIKNTEQ